jgi:hypothetical protein
MEYQAYLEAYRQAVNMGFRDEEDMLTECQWMVLSSVFQAQIVEKLVLELTELSDALGEINE